MVYYNLYITGSYNPIYNPTNHGFFSLLKCFPCRPNTCWECLFGISFWGSTCFLARCSGICLRWCLTFYHGLTPPFGEYFSNHRASKSKSSRFLGGNNFFPSSKLITNLVTKTHRPSSWFTLQPPKLSRWLFWPFFSRKRHYAPRFYTISC